MLGILLISGENGRKLKTYGPNPLKFYSMKFGFICLVIVLSCSVCASGDLEIYPDLKFDLSSEEQPQLSNDEDTFYGDSYRRLPYWEKQYANWRNRKKIQYDLELPERIQELLARNHPVYVNPASLEEAYDEYKNRQLDKLNLKYVALDDIRPYPHENDFSFGEEEQEEMPRQRNKHHDDFVMSTQSHEDDALKNAKFVQDPSQFAYPPTDPRFFQKFPNDKEDQNLDLNSIRVSQRSGDSFHDQDTQVLPARLRDNKGEQVKVVAVEPQITSNESAGVYIIAVVAGISAAATVGLIAVGIGWYNLQKHVKNASDVEYPAYGVTGPNKDTSPSGDRRLAQSAQMYHYQHQKQQIIAMESRAAAGERHGSVSEADSEEENEEGDYTVYECPGLAPTGEMEVKNPLFQDDPTPAQTPQIKTNAEEKK